ncbi:hypothetical protein ONZ45_g8704 [Pleurotus djamor]|nr:hypothetical protein ONZ45_g8704 [Pleurotus djamor]
MVVYPPTDGSLLLSQIVDFNSEHNTWLPVFKYHADGSDTHIVNPTGSDEAFTKVVAIVALCDTIVYQALMLGIHKAGFIPFPISPRNSPAAVIRLLKATNCHRIIATKVTLKALIEGVQSQLDQDKSTFSLTVDEVPSLESVFPKLGYETANDEFSPYPDYPVKPSLSSLALYLHSSGSTGFPKPIPLTQTSIVHWATLPAVTDMITHEHPKILGAMALPSFHTLGIYCQVLAPLFAVRPSSVYPPVKTSEASLPISPTPDNILDHTKRTNCDALIVIPTLLHYWSHSPESMEFLRSLYIVSYSGGAPPPKLGHALHAAGVVTRPIYGGTEFGAPTHWVPTPEERANDEWQWIRFSENISKEMVPQGGGVYELCVLRSAVDHINVFNGQDKLTYATSDLFEKHPSIDGLWKIVGRKDDVIVHSSGEKTVPGPMEDIIASHPGIQGIILFGERQSQPGALIELKDNTRFPTNDEELQSLRNEFWPIVEEANKLAPTFSRVYKDMILFASPDKPLPRAGKGTVMRKAALAVYDAEIQNIYNTIEAGVESSSAGKGPSSWKSESLLPWLQAHASDLVPKGTFSLSDDLFAHGFDSLNATLLRHRIVSALRQHEATSSQHVDVPQTLVYDNPTLERLAVAVEALASGPTLTTQMRAERIESLITYQLSQLQPLSKTTPGATSTGATVLLTGSTGGLGTHILADLLLHPQVEAVYTLNRSSASLSSGERQNASFKDRGLDMSLLNSDKLIVLEGSLNEPNFGLEAGLYEKLHQSVNVIIHNAWKVDFNFPLHAFEPLISGTLNLINFARTGSFSSSTRFIFSSSISAVQGWNSNQPVPEEAISTPEVAIGNGYGESKYVVERMLAASGVQACSLRIGQVCGGAPNGAWSLSDWFPISVKSSVSLKALPDVKGVVSWVPMDVISKTVLDVAFFSGSLPSVINVVHPKPVPWTSTVAALQASIRDVTRGKVELPIAPMSEWVRLLEGAAENAKDADIRKIPAMKLMSFFARLAQADSSVADDQESGGWPNFPTNVAQSLSPSLANAEPLGKPTISAWVAYWANAALFTT